MEKNLFTEYFVFRLAINSISMVLLVRFIYYGVYKKRDLFAPFFLLNFIIFLLAYMLKVTGGFDSIGSAFGLLAAFSLLRFRTDTLSMKDMTYLFIVMTIGLINSAMAGSYTDILSINGIIIAAVFVVDGNLFMRNEKTKTVEIDSFENIKPEQEKILTEDIRKQTGLNIQKITIEHYDLIKKRATIKIYYY
jgi:hypothetical protein